MEKLTDNEICSKHMQVLYGSTCFRCDEEKREIMMATINDSGINACQYKCVVKLDPIEEKTSSGLIVKPDIVKEKERWQTIKATLVNKGGLAFTNPDWQDPTPQIGNRVYVAVAAGIVHKHNGNEYRIVNDQDIAGILTEE